MNGKQRHQASTLYVIAGPNGAGKTTFAREFLPPAAVVEFLNADLLAAGISPLAPGAAAMRAGRLLLTRWRELACARRDFAFESTLSGRTYAGMISRARHAGYRVRICYLWVPSATVCLRRVRQRVQKGGHHVPAADVRRRFVSSLRHFFQLYLPLADEALLFDASHKPPRMVVSWRAGQPRIFLADTYEKIQKLLHSARD